MGRLAAHPARGRIMRAEVAVFPDRRGGWAALPPDPYLVWLSGTGFVDTPGAGPGAAGLDLLIELVQPWPGGRPEVSTLLRSRRGQRTNGQGRPSWRDQPLGVMPGSVFVTARNAPAELIDAMVDGPLRALVRRFECCEAMTPTRKPAAERTRGNVEPAPRSTASCLVGVLDDGVPFGRASLLRADGGSRLLSLWSQGTPTELQAGDRDPVPYGRSADRHRIDRWLDQARRAGFLDEDRLYRLAGYETLRRGATHGAAVMDLLAGRVPWTGRRTGAGLPSPRFHAVSDAAAQADLVFVQLPRRAIEDNSGRWLGVPVLDGLRHIVGHAGEATQRIVVNLSYGPQTGPHDGGALLERAMDELSRLEPRLALVLPAGNSFALRAHARLTPAPDVPLTLRWFVPPATRTPAFLELWLPADRADNLELRCQPPGDGPPIEAQVGRSRGLRGDGCSDWLAAALFAPRVAQGGQLDDDRPRRTMALLAVAPTEVWGGRRAAAPHGEWRIECRVRAGGPLPLVAYVARNGTDLGVRTRSRPSFLSDAAYDPRRAVRAALDDERPEALVRRRGSLSGVATGETPHVIAGHRASDGRPSVYSSAGPTLSATRPGPTASLPCDDSPGRPGLRVAGTRSGASVRLVGTSLAAPLYARLLADGAAPGNVQGQRTSADPEREGVQGRLSPELTSARASDG